MTYSFGIFTVNGALRVLHYAILFGVVSAIAENLARDWAKRRRQG